jgi:hypothetical protein
MVSVRKNLQTAWPGKVLADRADLFPKMLASLNIPLMKAFIEAANVDGW